MEKLTEQEVIRRQKMEDLRAMGIEPFGHAYQRTHKSGEIRAAYEDCAKEELEEKDLVRMSSVKRPMRCSKSRILEIL